MYPLRMIHADHGAMTVYGVAERKEFEAKGWKVQTEEEFQAVLAAKRGVPKLGENEGITPAAYIAPENVVEIKRKPGRPAKVK